MQYKDRILRHYDNTLQYDSNGLGNFLSFAGSYAEVQAGLRIKSIEANGNLYFTTAAGIETISALNSSQFTTAAGYIRPAGGIQALDVSGVVDYAGGGWFIYQTDSPGQTKVAYRTTWGFNDANGNFVEGAPSSRLVLTNYSTTNSANVDLTFQIPSGIGPTDHQFFYRIYRTGIVQTSVGVSLNQLDPGDEENLVIQDFPTAAELSTYTFTVTAADATAGATYTNNGQTFTVLTTITGGTTLVTSGTGNSLASGTLTKVTGAGDATITYSAVVAPTRVVTVTDNVPDAFRKNGTLLYTNPISGEGILQSNYPPPIAHDINLFQNTVFYANTQTIQQLNLSLLSVENLISGTSSITIDSETYTFIGTKEIQQIQFNDKATTNDGGYWLLNSASNARKYFVWYSKVGAVQIQNLQFDDFTDTVDGGYFLIYSADDVTKYVVWFDKSGTTLPPAGADTFNGLFVRVPIVSGVTTSDDVATAVINAAAGQSDFGLANLGTGIVQVTNLVSGLTSDAIAGATAPGPNFTSGYLLVQAGVDPTAQPDGSDTLGRLPIFVDIASATTAVDVAQATIVSLNSVADFNASGFATFTVTAANASVGDVYSNNSQLFTVLSGISGGTTLSVTNTGTPLTSGTLTKVSGAGDATIAFSAYSFTPDETVYVMNTDNGACDPAVDSVVVPTPLASATIVQTGTGEDVSAQEILLGGSLSPSQNIDETARSIVRVVNGNPDGTVNAFYQSGPTDLPGLILFQARSLVQGPFAITANSTATGAEFSPALPTTGSTVSSTNLVELNAIYYSKFQQPEAVPIVNKFLVGPKDRAILRILPLRTGLMIIKEDGIYRLTGVNGQFQIDPFDNSAICLAADSAQILNNQIYMFSTQGVVTLTDTGVSVISRPIEDQLNRITTPSFDFKPNTFGVSYESDRAYLMWTVTNTDDDQPTQCFRYNTFTNAWTRWPIVKTCGLVLFSSQVLYLGPGDENFIEIERKNINRTDYADRVYPLQLASNSVVNEDTIALSSVANVQVGDVLVQTQYLTIDQYNQLLRMLDSDPNVGYKNYFSTLGVLPGADLRSALDSLANKLDTDAGIDESDFASSMTGGTTFADLQTDFNILTALLNTNVNVHFSNYVTSIGTLLFEMIIIGLVQNTNNVIVQYTSPVIQGGILLYRGIKADVVWAPQIFGDPSISKHVSEGTFMFDDTSFFSATISYASDLMPSFEAVTFPELGIGDWGGFSWNSQSWGGGGTSTPIRTYIPRNKQYCRFIRPRFTHNNAREKFSLLGGSLTFRQLTERAYRS